MKTLITLIPIYAGLTSLHVNYRLAINKLSFLVAENDLHCQVKVAVCLADLAASRFGYANCPCYILCVFFHFMIDKI